MRYSILISMIFIATQVFADQQNISPVTEGDSLEQLSETLRSGSYTHPDDFDLPPISNTSVKLRQKTIELNNEEIEERYGSTAYRAIAKRYVNSDSINVRNKPNGTIIDRLKRGQSVFIYDVSGDWERISKESESQRWVDSSLLCSYDGCYTGKTLKSSTVNRAATYTPVTSKKQTYSIGGCSCGTGNYCYGPRGGRYCYTSGGNKSYR